MKIYELTSNGLDGYGKYLVRGLKNDNEARQLAKKVFGYAYSPSLISYYSNSSKTPSMTKAQFLKYKKKFRMYN